MGFESQMTISGDLKTVPIGIEKGKIWSERYPDPSSSASSYNSGRFCAFAIQFLPIVCLWFAMAIQENAHAQNRFELAERPLRTNLM